MKRFIAVVLVLGVAIIALAVWSSRAGEPATNAAEVEGKNLEGKFLGVDLDRALDRHASWLHNAHVQTIGGEPFLIGTAFSITDEGKIEDHLALYVALRHVEQIYAFGTVDELKKIYQKQ
jgi:hypothetical protein